ncbi:sterol desaturase family protein [Solimonas terrae]|uniref:Sterol desaturase family protein n=1 Tax=Solimonas terrae TaxID=1396819 RepID=A0A6M2BMB0_9GAMM|nr:sterol desaturase family protein [Solimonas terrae]NGY03726.1 sterol desaturase family protein [Solimonas terrae]
MEDVLHALSFIAAAGVIFIGVVLAEAWYWRRRGVPEKYALNDTVSNMTMGLSYKLVDGVFVALLGSAFFDLVHPYGLQYRPVHGIWSVLLIFVISDFTFYVSHLIWHKVRWFWTSHAVHHSSNRMNYSTALRQNYLVVLNGGNLLIAVVIALVGFNKTWAIVALELNLLYQFFLHTEAPSFLDRFGAVLNTPSHHRVHHGANPAQIDRNFGGVLIIWDRLFGTFRAEKDAGEIVYGVTERQPSSFNPFYLQLHEMGTLLRDLWRYRDPRILVRHPAWAERRYGGDRPG